MKNELNLPTYLKFVRMVKIRYIYADLNFPIRSDPQILKFEPSN